MARIPDSMIERIKIEVPLWETAIVRGTNEDCVFFDEELLNRCVVLTVNENRHPKFLWFLERLTA